METGIVSATIGPECRGLHNSTRALKHNMLQACQSCEENVQNLHLLRALKESAFSEMRVPLVGPNKEDFIVPVAM